MDADQINSKCYSEQPFATLGISGIKRYYKRFKATLNSQQEDQEDFQEIVDGIKSTMTE